MHIPQIKPRRFIVPLAFLTFCLSCVAADQYYIRAGATGANTGEDWTNAFSAFPATLTRGSIYYVADGTYPGKVFTTPNSGTTSITVKKANQDDHGTSSGWANSYGDGQAIFTGCISFKTSYWVFDGQKGEGTGKDVPYGFFINTGEGSSAIQISNTLAAPAVNVSVSYTELQGVSSLTDYFYSSGTKPLWVGYSTNASVSNCYIHGGESLISTETGVPGTGSTGMSITNCVLQAARSSNPAFHSNVFYCTGADSGTFAYNTVFNYSDEGLFFTGYQASPSNWKVYGNVFYSTGKGEVNPRGIELRQNYNYSGIVIFNNTFVNLPVGAILNRTGETGNRTTSCNAQNNLSSSASFSLGDFSTANNNSSVASSAFVNAAAYDFRLVKPIPGLSLSSEFRLTLKILSTATDIVRGVDGVWDQGAYEYSSGGSSILPPSNATLSVNQQ